MLDATQIELLDITTRMESHKPLAGLSAKRNIVTIVQKPFAPTWDECMDIVENARNHGTWLAVHENFRFATTMRRVKAVIDSGVIVTANWARLSFLTGYNVYRGQLFLATVDRFVILDLGIHVLDLARFFLEEVKHLSCKTQKRNPAIRGEDTATVMLRHDSGAI